MVRSLAALLEVVSATAPESEAILESRPGDVLGSREVEAAPL
jgi:hypothetical protein